MSVFKPAYVLLPVPAGTMSRELLRWLPNDPIGSPKEVPSTSVSTRANEEANKKANKLATTSTNVSTGNQIKDDLELSQDPGKEVKFWDSCGFHTKLAILGCKAIIIIFVVLHLMVLLT